MRLWKNNGYTRIAMGWTLCFMVAFVLFFPLSASANAPKELKLAYEASSQNLKVTITHASPFPSSHYIKSVEIKINGKTALTKEYKSQPAETPFTYAYDIAASPGDVLEVTAACSFYGSKTEKLTIVK